MATARPSEQAKSVVRFAGQLISEGRSDEALASVEHVLREVLEHVDRLKLENQKLRNARIYDGADEVHKSVVARRILKGYGVTVRE